MFKVTVAGEGCILRARACISCSSLRRAMASTTKSVRRRARRGRREGRGEGGQWGERLAKSPFVFVQSVFNESKKQRFSDALEGHLLRVSYTH